jgi:translin
MSKPLEELEIIAAEIRPYFIVEDETREKALRLCRQIIQYSANAVRAMHRQEENKAKELLHAAHELNQNLNHELNHYGELLYSGFVHDAQKEFAEACITFALTSKENLPKPQTLNVSYAAYLNGLGEAVGELRRYILDRIRRGEFSRCEELLGVMDDVYGVLMSMDFPEALTHGLRRTSDSVRGIVERTRGDLTIALRQRELEAKLSGLANKSGELA